MHLRKKEWREVWSSKSLFQQCSASSLLHLNVNLNHVLNPLERGLNPWLTDSEVRVLPLSQDCYLGRRNDLMLYKQKLHTIEQPLSLNWIVRTPSSWLRAAAEILLTLILVQLLPQVFLTQEDTRCCSGMLSPSSLAAEGGNNCGTSASIKAHISWCSTDGNWTWELPGPLSSILNQIVALSTSHWGALDYN